MSNYIEGQTHQLAEALQRADFLPDHLTKLGQNQALLRQIKDVLDGLAEIKPIEKKPEPLIDFLGEVTIPATTAKFVAKDRFVVNTKSDAPVKISYRGDNFIEWFLLGKGKIEDPITEQTLRYGKLLRPSVDMPIINELGGEEKSETTLTEMYYLMERQKNGENGVLLNNGYANIFYLCDCAGVLRTVGVLWNDGGWSVCAGPVGDPDRWRGDCQVFSRK